MNSDSDRSRREFLAQTAAVSAAALVTGTARAAAPTNDASAGLVKQLYGSLSDVQRSAICFDWDHRTEDDRILRTHVSNNWQVSSHKVVSDFYTTDQQELIEAIFWSLYSPEWKGRIRKQLVDDAGGYGKGQSIALFGDPAQDQFELVMTGRHLTIRCDGNTTPHVAFGGPIFYGHQAGDFEEEPDHPGNVFWSQAVKANEVYGMLDGRQRRLALVKESPAEEDVHFRGTGELPGIRVSELSADQLQHLTGVLQLLVEPYRQQDRNEALQCLEAQGGLERCALSFYESDDLGEDGIWDTWRLEGPSFVWHYRGDPHVHVWANVANDAGVKISTEG